MQNTTRNATLADLATLLTEQHARKIDVVAPASQITANHGLIVVKGAEPIITEDGVTNGDGRYQPTVVFDEGMAHKLGIPQPYLKALRQDRIDLYDANVNGWLHGNTGEGCDLGCSYPGDDRSFLFRGFIGDEPGSVGVARAFLSDSYKVIDNLDALTAALDGVRQAQTHVEIDGCDLSERRMYVRVKAPSITALAPTLLRNYRSPFNGDTGADNPTVFAGFIISNSETGSGAFTITPRLIVQVCSNGMTITKDALRSIHLGGKMDEGIIRWGEDTQRKSLELVTAKTRDAVATFLDTDYMSRAIADLEEKAGVKLTGAVDEKVRQVGKKLQFDQSHVDGVLAHFIQAGDLTAGGVMQAVTSFAQTVASPDDAADLESSAIRALEMAASLA
jgi:hypothetical protein